MQLPPGMIGANTQIRFVTAGTFDVGGGTASENFFVDNVNIADRHRHDHAGSGHAGNNYATTYAENARCRCHCPRHRITDDGTTIDSARVVLTNASAGDVLIVPVACQVGSPHRSTPASPGRSP